MDFGCRADRVGWARWRRESPHRASEGNPHEPPSVAAITRIDQIRGVSSAAVPKAKKNPGERPGVVADIMAAAAVG